MTEALTVRASSLSRYADCPRATAARLFRKEIEGSGYELADSTNSIAAAIGTGVHAMVAELFKQKASYGKLNVREALAAREEAFEAEVNKGALWDATTPHIDTAKKQLAAIGEAFLPLAETITPGINCKGEPAIEDELEWLIVSPLGREAVPIRLIGHRDVKDSRNEIHDHKTGASFPACHAQLGAYAYLSRKLGEEVSAVRVNYVPRLPLSRRHEVKVRSVRFDLGECLHAAETALIAIQRDYMEWLESKDPWSFLPNPYSQSCTPKYCSAFGTAFCKVGGTQ